MRQSFSQRARQRKALYFETMEEAGVGVGKRKKQDDLGERKKNRHSPPPNHVNFDKENLLQEVTNMKDGEKVSLLCKFTPIHSAWEDHGKKKVHVMCVKFSFSLKI